MPHSLSHCSSVLPSKATGNSRAGASRSVTCRAFNRRALLGGLSAGVILGIQVDESQAGEVAGFLRRNGGKGPLADEEDFLLSRRIEEEAVVQ